MVGDREYVVARARCRNCNDHEPILLWRTEFDDHPAVETWKHASDGTVVCGWIPLMGAPPIASPLSDSVERVRDEP